MSTPAPTRTRPMGLRPAQSLALALVNCGMAMTSGQVVQAQDTAGSDWSYSVAPYLWGAGLSGQAGTFPNLPPADFDLSFSDVLDNLDGAAMIVGQAWNGRWGISADLQHVKTTSTGSKPEAGIARAELESTTQSFSVQLDYLVYSENGTELWASGGARYWNVETDLTLSDGVNPAVSGSGSDSWWDPVVGLRASMPLGAHLHLNGWAYLGGFGAGSDRMSDVFAGVGYRFGARTAVVGGLRYQSVERRSGSFVWDVEQYGPLIGLSITF